MEEKNQIKKEKKKEGKKEGIMEGKGMTKKEGRLEILGVKEL